MPPDYVTRFAPSPTGPLHLGHAYSALLAWDMAVAAGGSFLLRIEDIDQCRCRPEWEAQIYDDLKWLGIWWDEPVMRQSDRRAVYRQTLVELWEARLAFQCICSRRDVESALSAPQEGYALPMGPDGKVYPGTCKDNASLPYFADPCPQDAILRLEMHRAALRNAEPHIGSNRHYFKETGHGPSGETGLISFSVDELVSGVGDIVLARKDFKTSYHLSVVLDDAAQGITHVIRGQDLFDATKIHVVLQRALGLPTPVYHHHRLIRDDAGKRLAKRDDARALSKYRNEGATPADIRALVGL